MASDEPKNGATKRRAGGGNFDPGAMNLVGWLLLAASVAVIGVGVLALTGPPGPGGGGARMEIRFAAWVGITLGILTFVGGRFLLNRLGVSVYRPSRR